MSKIIRSPCLLLSALCAPLIIAGCSAGLKNQPPTPGVRVTDKLANDTLILLRDASKNYPVPYVRDTLTALFEAVARQEAEIVFVSRAQPAYINHWARFRQRSNGRMTIEINQAHIISSFASVPRKDAGALTDRDFEDWLVLFVTKEWYRLKHAIDPEDLKAVRGPAFPLGEYLTLLESTAWAGGYTDVIVPGKRAGRFRFPLSLGGAMSVYCLQKTGGEYRHPEWGAFILWSLYEGAKEPNCFK